MLEINVKFSALRILFHSQLSPLYPAREIDAIFFTYIDDKYNINKYQFFLDTEQICFEARKAMRDLKKLAKGCPIQYILGKTIFYNIELKVNPSVLIPRPETEELVEAILNSHWLKPMVSRILDLCTGSGAIAVALAKNIKNAAVWATDISEKALQIAQENATLNNVDVTFLHHDILKDGVANLPDNLDVIVSNPPYIPQSESVNMHKNVVDFEPQKALFVPDESPLIFYNAIANFAKKNLRAGGVLYFETYEKFHFELSEMLTYLDFKEIILWNDINGKPRFGSCKKL